LSAQIALFIDAENVSHRDLPRILDAITRQGQVVLRAVYGDWQRPDLQKWLEIAPEFQLRIRRHNTKSKIKNSSDMKLVMDVMEVMFRTPIETFCIVSNDADYVPLCDKIRETKKYVIGIGYQHASDGLIRACNQFIFVEHSEPLPTTAPLVPTTNNAVPLIQATNNITPTLDQNHQLAANDTTPKPATNSTASKPALPQPSPVQKILIQAFATIAADANGWVTLSSLGTAIRQIHSNFNIQSYGHSQLSKLLESLPDFVELRGQGSVQSVRLKPKNWLNHTHPSQPLSLLLAAFNKAPLHDNNWVTLSALGSSIRQIDNTFNPSTYGHATLSKWLETMPDFVELRVQGSVKSARLKK
jgi:hypothetical protein